MKKENEKNVKDQRIQAFVIVILVFLLVILVIGITFAAFSYSQEGNVVNQVSTGTMTMNYVEGKTGISITNAMPITEEAGKDLSNPNEIFDFTISTKVSGTQAIIYEITAAKQEEIECPSNNAKDCIIMGNSDVRLYLQEGDSPDTYNKETLKPTAYTPIDADDSIGAKKGEMILATVGATTTKTTYYRLRMWVDSDYDLTDKTGVFAVKVNAYGKSATREEVEAIQ